MQPRDIYTRRLLDDQPTLGDLLAALPLDVAGAVLGKVVADETDLAAHVATLSGAPLDKAIAIANLVLKADLLPKEEVEELAKGKGIAFSGSDSAFLTVHKLVAKIGPDAAEKLLVDKLKPTHIARKGSFAEFKAPAYELDALKPLDFIAMLENGLEKTLSEGATDQRLVKVRPERVGTSLCVGVYFQRPHVDGPRVLNTKGKGKSVRPDKFERSAGRTYFIVRANKRATRVTLKSPDGPLAKAIKRALGQTLWSNMNAISDQPIETFNLSLFKDPSLTLDILDKYSKEIDKVIVSEIHVRAASGTLLTVKAPGRRGDALDDFEALSRGARALVQNSDVTKVVLKFLPVDDERSLAAHVTVEPKRLHLNDTEWKLATEHLKHWGIIGE